MGDQDDRTAAAQTDQRRDQLRLGSLIERARCLIEQQYRPIPVERARDADSLSLSRAQHDSALADPMLVCAGQRLDELLELRQAGRLDQTPRVDGRTADAERDVF